MRATTLILTLVFLLHSSALAKRVEDGQHLFSVEIPNDWQYRAGAWNGSGRDWAYESADRSVVLGLKSYDIGGWTLEQWTNHVTSQIAAPETPPRISKAKLNKVNCRLLDWGVTNDRFLLSWMASKGDRGAGITLSYPTKTKENILVLRQQLANSFRWVR